MLYVLTGVIALAYAVVTLPTGVRVSPDTATYSRWADLLIAHGFNISSYLNEQSFVVPPVLYLLWIVVVAALKTVLGQWWMAGIVTLNWIALSVGAFMTLRTVRRLTGSAAALLMAGALFLVAADLMIFVPFVLSDLIFWGMSTCVVAMGVAAVSAEDGDRRPARMLRVGIGGTALTAIALGFRPAAVPLAVLWIGAMLLHICRNAVVRWLEPLMGIAVLLAVAAIAAHAYVLMHPSAWPFGPLPAILDLLASEYRSGVLVYAPGSSLTVAPALDWTSAMRLTLEKWLYFSTPWLPQYSAVHAGLNLLFFAPAYGLSVAALANMRRLRPSQQRAAALLAIFALALSVFHAMMQIEYDHRYRLPLLPALIMLAAIGLESVRRPRTLASSARGKLRATAGA